MCDIFPFVLKLLHGLDMYRKPNENKIINMNGFSKPNSKSRSQIYGYGYENGYDPHSVLTQNRLLSMKIPKEAR